MILRLYQYLYYRTYLWQEDRYGEMNQPKFTAFLLVSLLMIMLIVCILGITDKIFGSTMIIFFMKPINNLMLSIPILIINYFLSMKNHRKILSRFEALETGERKMYSRALVISLSVVSLFIVGCVIYLIRESLP